MSRNVDAVGFLGQLLEDRRILWGLFAVMVAAQLFVPAQMILGREEVLAEGEVFNFRTAPVDPYDAFRGRYVALRFDAESQEIPAPEGLGRGDRAYGSVSVGADDFARIERLWGERPEDRPSVRVEVRSVVEGQAIVNLPFDRYYLPEDLAPAAERAYRDANRRGGQPRDAWARVRLLDGRAVLEEVVVQGIPISELARDPSLLEDLPEPEVPTP